MQWAAMRFLGHKIMRLISNCDSCFISVSSWITMRFSSPQKLAWLMHPKCAPGFYPICYSETKNWSWIECGMWCCRHAPEVTPVLLLECCSCWTQVVALCWANEEGQEAGGRFCSFLCPFIPSWDHRKNLLSFLEVELKSSYSSRCQGDLQSQAQRKWGYFHWGSSQEMNIALGLHSQYTVRAAVVNEITIKGVSVRNVCSQKVD